MRAVRGEVVLRVHLPAGMPLWCWRYGRHVLVWMLWDDVATEETEDAVRDAEGDYDGHENKALHGWLVVDMRMCIAWNELTIAFQLMGSMKELKISANV